MSRRGKFRPANLCADCHNRLQWITLVNRGPGRDDRKRVPVDTRPLVDRTARLLEVRYSPSAQEHVGRWLPAGRQTPTEPGWALASLHASTCRARKRVGPKPVRDLDPHPGPVPPHPEQLALELPTERTP